MRLSDFSYLLPDALIARYPLPQRSDSRLLQLNRTTGEIFHQKFESLSELLAPEDLLILNNTKVFPARLFGEKDTGGKVEILVEKIIDDHCILAHCRASKRPKAGQILYFGNTFKARVITDQHNLLSLTFEDKQSRSIREILSDCGHIPLPPYLNRSDEMIDRERYQTVYAEKSGSVAAPTAGLHFTEALLAKLPTAFITLHVGAGTFQPVRTDTIDAHLMHAEYAEISPAVCEKIQRAKSRGGRIIAVGTTTMRTLETASLSGKIKPFYGETRLFIKPGFNFHCVNGLITNFHLPQSTLLMLVCAFGGYNNVMHAYQEAINEKYRFFSYGDAMLLV
jgi:S-adenosylmethionine:tRNA ribosyltransferase-isomerase